MRETGRLAVSEWMTLDGVFDADAFLLGRKTYELLGGYWPTVTDRRSAEIRVADRLSGAPKYVVSTTLRTASWTNSTIIRERVVDSIARLKQQPGGDILLLGSGALARTLMEAGLIDEYRFLVHPIVMGRGKRFFESAGAAAPLKLVASQALSRGVTALRYRPAGARIGATTA